MLKVSIKRKGRCRYFILNMYSIKIGDCHGSLDLLKQKFKEPKD